MQHPPHLSVGPIRADFQLCCCHFVLLKTKSESKCWNLDFWEHWTSLQSLVKNGFQNQASNCVLFWFYSFLKTWNGFSEWNQPFPPLYWQTFPRSMIQLSKIDDPKSMPSFNSYLHLMLSPHNNSIRSQFQNTKQVQLHKLAIHHNNITQFTWILMDFKAIKLHKIQYDRSS